MSHSSPGGVPASPYAGDPVRRGMLWRLDRAFVSLNRWLMIAALAGMAVIVFANVSLRYLTDESIVWSEEVARYLMIWLTFLGVGPVLRAGGHIAVDTLLTALPKRAAQGLRLIVLLLIAGFCLAAAWYGYALVQRTIPQTTPVTDISFAFVSAAVPTGFLLALWHLIAIAKGYVADAAFEPSDDLNPNEAGSI